MQTKNTQTTSPATADAARDPKKLTIGHHYNCATIRPLFARFSLTNGEPEPANFTDIIEGYHPDNYFAINDGRYLGPDEAGVEPLYYRPGTIDGCMSREDVSEYLEHEAR
jgi:hypothetical protein